MDDDDGNFPPVRRGTVGADTHIPLETSPASASPRSTGPLDDLSRQRRREPLPPQSHRYKEASDFTSRPPLSGSNRAIPQPQASAQGPHRSYPPSSKDPGVPSSRQPNTDTSRLDRSRGSGHDPGHAYVDKFSRDDHMKGDPHYSSRGEINAAPASPSLITPTRMIVENVRGRSRDRSPRGHREPRQMSTQSLSASLPAMQPGPPQDMQFVEDHRPRGRRIDCDREGHSPTLQRNPSNLAAPKSRSTGRYDGLEGGMNHHFAYCLYPTDRQ
ncbi:hypothetical protein BC826DRAFT_1024125 [Russula brevipes]|nr:hypothetical protein BC826DRAFT_1024125 [Russula brevipes]